jgi:hypothetical protein
MNRVHLAVGTFFLFVTAAIPFTKIHAQSKSTKVTIVPIEIFSYRSDVGNEDPDWRFRLFYQGTVTNDCIGVDNSSIGSWITVPAARQFLVSNRVVSDFTQDIDLGLEAFEEDGCGGDCEYKATTLCASNSDDEHCGFSNQPLNLFNLTPGAPGGTTNVIVKGYCGPDYFVKYRVSYTPPAPAKPTVKVDGTDYPSPPGNYYYLCGNNTIELSTSIATKAVYNSQITYTWEYHISGETTTVYTPNPAYCGDTPGMCDGSGGPIAQVFSFQKAASKSVTPLVAPPGGGDPPPCCYEDPYLVSHPPLWRTVSITTNAGTNGGKLSINIRSLTGLANIATNKTVQFRLAASANSLTGDYSPVSDVINVSPLPPTIGSVSYLPSCPNKNTGEIHLKGVSGIGSYQYNLRPGHYNNLPCNPETDGSCFSADITGSASGADFVIPNVPSGPYTIWLVNKATNSGSCFVTYDTATVKMIPKLSLSLSGSQNVSCNGGGDGTINLSKSGGVSPYVFSLTGQPDNATGVFGNLAAGNYNATVTDGCAQTYPETIVDNIKITQPPKVSETVFSPENALCSDPGNGKFTSKVTKSSGTYDLAVSSTYSFLLYKDGIRFDSTESDTGDWTRSNLPVSDQYQLVVKEKGGAGCNSYVKDFEIGPPPDMAATLQEKLKVSCYGGSDGKITFTASGGSDQFIFKLTKSAGTTLQNITGIFSGLKADDYSLVVQNGLTGCQDEYTYPSSVKVDEPFKINITLAKTDISCYGLTDGKIDASVSGGTPGYTSIWQRLIAGSWSGLSNTNIPINNLSEGSYRLMVQDSKSCTDSSASVDIIEPAFLEIDSVSLQDIRCLNEKGQIKITSKGGTGAHTYYYSLNGGVSTAFTSATQLSAGNYVVAVKDANSCSYTDPDTYMITSPPAALDFSYVQSDFNNFNISCFGGNNGTITVTATGGNGPGYSGFEFAKDNGVYQADNFMDQFNAGSHAISVRDNRGCEVTKNVQFTQTDSAINLTLKNKQDIVCYGDRTGVLELQAAGGLSPYLFNIDSGEKQSSGVFSGLGQKTYHTTVYDKNNCDISFDYTIDLLNPHIEISASIHDVSCFDGSDGSIGITINGGVAPLHYQWKDQNNTTSLLQNVKTGNFTILVTDNAGCKEDSVFTVLQPAAALQAKINVIPVCVGKDNGVITITPAGGTSPYQFSVNNGQSYQSDPVFNTVGVGDYPVKVVDKNGCISTGSATIIKRNDLPIPDFIVATKEHALDTLLVREISIPQPDSVHWIFDPAAIVVNNDQWSPEIVFTEAGEYSVTMIGYFQACDYSASHTITLRPFDPNAVPASDPSLRAIESVEVTPNPNDGAFDVTIRLNKKYRLSLTVYDVLGGIHYNKSWETVQEAAERITLQDVSAGVYLLRAVTNNDARDVRIIINK